MQPTTLPDITSALSTVTGGGKLKAAWQGAKATYKAVRPWMKGAADVIENAGGLVAGGYGVKQAWDWATGTSDREARAQP